MLEAKHAKQKCKTIKEDMMGGHKFQNESHRNMTKV